MEYPALEEKCPLCGHSEVLPDEEEYLSEPDPVRRPAQGEKRPRRRTGARVAPSSSSIPKWLVVLTCLILALAVIIFVLFLLSRAGVFDIKEPDGGSVTLPLDPADGENGTGGEQDADQLSAGGEIGGEQQSVLCTGISLDPENYTPSEAGEKLRLTAVVEPADCTDEIVWSSSNPMSCAVSDDGIVTIFEAAGDVTISATCGAYTATCVIDTDALDQPAQSDPDAQHSISAEDITFFSAGEYTTLRLSNTLDGDEVVWESEDPEIVSVTDDGKVTAVASGTTNVHATLNGKTYTCIVRCNFINSPGTGSEGSETAENGRYTISHEDVTLHYLENESFRLTLDGFDGTVTWSTSDESVCTVDGNTVTAVGSGTARVSAIVGSATYTCIVRCIE